MKSDTVSRIGFGMGIAALIGLVGIAVGIFMLAVPVIVHAFEGFIYWLTVGVGLPEWFMHQSLAVQIISVSTFVFVLSLLCGAYLVFSTELDPDPDGPL